MGRLYQTAVTISIIIYLCGRVVHAVYWVTLSLSNSPTSCLTMTLAFLPISYFLSNGMSVDDLGLLLLVLAVVILMTGVLYRAAVS